MPIIAAVERVPEDDDEGEFWPVEDEDGAAAAPVVVAGTFAGVVAGVYPFPKQYPAYMLPALEASIARSPTEHLLEMQEVRIRWAGNCWSDRQ